MNTGTSRTRIRASRCRLRRRWRWSPLYKGGIPWMSAAPIRRAARASRSGAGARSLRLILVSLVAGFATTPYAALPLSPARALRRDRQSPGDAGRIGLVMPTGILGVARDAVRVRRPVLAADGRGHRLDDRGRAVGREPARRGRPHGGLRRRAAVARQRRAGRCCAC